MNNSFFGFGAIAAVIAGVLFALLWDRTDLHLYLIWLISLSGATFVIYGLDKLKSTDGSSRAPEKLLHLLAVAGGFVGAWLGRFVFRHKINRRKHPEFVFWLWFSLLVHAFLVYYIFLRESQLLLDLTAVFPAA